jgi:iron complex transport system permease protein
MHSGGLQGLAAMTMLPAGRGGVLTIIPILTVVLAAAVAVGLATGAFPITLDAVGRALARLWSGAAPQAADERVLLSIRGPRVIAGVLVGAALSAAGVVYQGLFRNPLVSPDVLGVSAGAGLGAVAGIFLSLPVFAIQVLAFAGGLATVSLVYLIAAAVQGRDPTLALVLGGVVVGALAGAAISLLKILADPYDQLPAITFWLLGSLASTRSGEVWAILPALVVGLVPLVLLRWHQHPLTRRRGGQVARHRGWPATRHRHRGGDTDHGKCGVDLRRDRLGRPRHPSHRTHAGGAQLPAPAPGRHVAGRKLPRARRHDRALHRPY